MKCLLSALIAVMATSSSIFAYNTNTTTNPGNQVEYFQGSFENGKNKAGTDGKLFFVEFYANWCTPCKWMDKTTFKNENVVDLLNENYVALKMDIESNEGGNLKEKFSVRMLPTILIFNSKGEMVERVEKTLSSESMVSLLAYHNNARNKMAISHNLNTSPSIYSENRGPNLNHLYNQYQIAEKFRTNYKLQLGNYHDYNDAFDKVQELKEIFIEPIIVLNSYVDNTTQYRVLMGEFKTINEAESFRKILKTDFKMDSVVY